MIAFGMLIKPKRPPSKAQRQANARFSAGMQTPKRQDKAQSMAEMLQKVTGMRCGR